MNKLAMTFWGFCGVGMLAMALGVVGFFITAGLSVWGFTWFTGLATKFGLTFLLGTAATLVFGYTAEALDEA